jgi:hypothetical protein
LVGDLDAPAAIGSKRGDLGSKLPPVNGSKTIWFRGAREEVGFMLGANHGGGYQYSVCPKMEGAVLNEECFQNNVLSFVGLNHTIRYIDGRSELTIPARDVSEGTFPASSVWRVNPIPACNCDRGFGCSVDASDAPDISYWNGTQPIPKVNHKHSLSK